MIPRALKSIGWLLGSLALGWLALPALAYALGRRVIGPYEGSRGLASYAGSIYAAAGAGQPLALTMVFSPLLIFAIWSLHGYLRRRLLAEKPATTHG